jgi:hypothetical protein
LAVVGQEFATSAPHTGEAGFMNLDGLDFPVCGRGYEARCRAIINDRMVVAREVKCDLSLIENTIDMLGGQGDLPQVMVIEVAPGNEREGISCQMKLSN